MPSWDSERVQDWKPSRLGSSGLVTSFVDGSTDVAPDELPNALRQMASFLSATEAALLEEALAAREGGASG